MRITQEPINVNKILQKSTVCFIGSKTGAKTYLFWLCGLYLFACKNCSRVKLKLHYFGRSNVELDLNSILFGVMAKSKVTLITNGQERQEGQKGQKKEGRI